MDETTSSQLHLPEAPADQRDLAVAAWREPVTIDTYEPAPPTAYPMFVDARVYQGSSGKVYPLPFYERIAETKQPREWDAVHLENRWLRLMVLPQIGGRIHIALDKARGYDIFYRQNVIKPALVGLAGPWISGGVEFNWPQHHRPATFMPTDVEIERYDDGSVTVWCSDHDPFNRLKGMHGITLHPDRAVIELKVRLHNRTEDVQSFLWWANVAVRVHDDYQSFFPTDVHHVFDHAKRAVTTFPRAEGRYYGVDYPTRVSDADPEADRLDWWRNIPVPTSYMCVDSHDDFFGGYDHAAQAGFVHWADHHVSPGKKQWTWGNSEFGRAWERHLTDSDGPYIELMAGVYTDNQPDFSFLAPGETKTFSQYWYPIHDTGPVHQATLEAAIRLEVGTPSVGSTPVEVGVAVTAPRAGVGVEVYDVASGSVLESWTADLAPGQPLVESVVVGGARNPDSVGVRVVHDGGVLLEWHRAAVPDRVELPRAAVEPPAPADVGANDELYLTGLHLSQYRHATRSATSYWEEAVGRDAGDSRSHVALSAAAYRRAEYGSAAAHARTAIDRLTALNPNPYDGEAYYRLGLALRRLGERDAAYDAFYKATWNAAWKAPSYLALAQISAARGRWAEALGHVERSLAVNAEDLRARGLRARLLVELGRRDEAQAVLAGSLALDPLDWWTRHLAAVELGCDSQTCIDVALEYAASGFVADALRVLDVAETTAGVEQFTGTAPLIAYHRAALLERLGDSAEASVVRQQAKRLSLDYCFPSRLEDETVLRAAVAGDPGDTTAAVLLGNWLYDRGRHADAIAVWRAATAAGADSPVVWRNLAVATYNAEGDGAAAMDLYEVALRCSPGDGRLLYERDQLMQRTGVPVEDRLALLEKEREVALARDDLAAELAQAYNDVGRPGDALEVLLSRRFQPWEGGEGRVLAAFERASLLLARTALATGDAAAAVDHVRAALQPPESIGEAHHPLANDADLWLALGDAASAAGHPATARDAWTRAATSRGDFEDMSVTPYSEMTYFSVLALRRLGDDATANELVDGLETYAAELRAAPATVDYFATSLPNLLLFRDDLRARQDRHSDVLAAQAAELAGRRDEAVRLLEGVLAADPSHHGARDLLRQLGAG